MNEYTIQTPPEPSDEASFRFESEEYCFIVFVEGEIFGLPVDRVQTIFQIEAVISHKQLQRGRRALFQVGRFRMYALE